MMDNRLHAATEVMVSRNQTLAHFQAEQLRSRRSRPTERSPGEDDRALQGLVVGTDLRECDDARLYGGALEQWLDNHLGRDVSFRSWVRILYDFAFQVKTVITQIG